MKKKKILLKKNSIFPFLFWSRFLFILLFAFFGILLPTSSPSLITQPLVKAAFVSRPTLPKTKFLVPPATTATAIFIKDLNSGLVLYAKNPNQRLAPASLTKIMTAIIALDQFSETSVLTVKNGDKSIGSKANLLAGDQFTSDSLLYALLLPSGNDAAVTFAENYAGGYTNFVNEMNRRVIHLGLTNTHFSNVSGVDGQDHYTTAYDIAEIAIAALQKPIFRQVVAKQKYNLTSLLGHHYPLENTNLLLGEPDIFGIKTGSTPEAGECLVTLVERDNHPIVISLMGSQNRFLETEKIINWVYSNYSWE